VVEQDPDRAREVADQHDVSVVDTVAEIKQARAATVAVPNRLHREVAVECIEAGLDVLVEKPLAMSVTDAQAIADAAADAGAILQVGHIERFNPAVDVLVDILENKEIIALEAHRLGPFNDHLTAESVVFDLMIHDIDVIQSLVDSPVRHVDAVGTQSRSSEIDHAIAHLKFDNGVLGTATSSHVTHKKVRSLAVTTRNVYIQLDYQQQQITVSRRESEQTTMLQGAAGYRTETIEETPFIRTREPLKNELEHFLDCVRSRSCPLVDAADGLATVEMANNIVDAIRSH
jgi:predicted dehydrogenase